MDIDKMHIVFRVLGQQVGMQKIRAILPESIDVFINETINEKVRTVVLENTNMAFRDRVSIHKNPISPINSIRTLYKTKSLSVPAKGADSSFYKVDMDIEKVMYFTSFNVDYSSKKIISTRFIESDFLADTLRDYCNSASWDYPIVSMFSDEDDKEYVQLFTDSETKVPQILNVQYIELPAVVKWDADVNKRVDCNLPESIHNEIVELAVSKFFTSVGYTTRNTPQG